VVAVSGRYPHHLAGHIALTPVPQGVYEIQVATQRIRIMVLPQLPPAQTQ
jgi:hypothetical protein